MKMPNGGRCFSFRMQVDRNSPWFLVVHWHVGGKHLLGLPRLRGVFFWCEIPCRRQTVNLLPEWLTAVQ